MTFQRATFAGAFTLAVAMHVSTVAMAQDDAGFRTEAEGDWYHPVDVQEWVSLGGDPTVIATTLASIRNATGERRDPKALDTKTVFEAGHWGREWEARGDEAMLRAAKGDLVENAAAAILYYQLASSPHTDDVDQRRALAKASESYLILGRQMPEDISQVLIPAEGKHFTAFVHLPLGEGPFPVVVLSNGSDQSKEEFLPYFRDVLSPRGIAMISLDLPGMGGSDAYDLRDGQTDKLHIAAVEWARANSSFDANNIFVHGGSFGGNAAARLFTKADQLDVAGVISSCAPLDAPFLASAEMYGHLPKFTMDGVRARLGLEADVSLEKLAEHLRPIALSHEGLMEGGLIETPLLVVTTNADPVAPLEDLDAFMLRAKNGTRVVLDEPGHCPSDAIEEILAASWIVDNMRTPSAH